VSLTPAGYDLVENMAREGQDFVTIAKHLGINRDTLKRLRDTDPEIVARLERGRAGLADELTAFLLRQVREKGNLNRSHFPWQGKA
jgi:hypothetical protein